MRKLLSCCAAALLLGCNMADTGDEGELAGNRDKWRAAEPARYGYQYRRSCFCPPAYAGPFRVTADRDSVLTVERMDWSDSSWTPVEDAKQDFSIEAIFDELARNLDRPAAVRKVHYDPGYGFPDSVAIDFDLQAADEEYGFEIRDFLPSP